MQTKRKLWDTLPILYLQAYLIIVLGEISANFFLPLLLNLLSSLKPDIAEDAFFETASLYGSFILVLLVIILWLYGFKKNRPILKMLGKEEKGNTPKLFLFGLLLGVGMNGFCAFIAFLHKDIALYFDCFKPVSFLILFVLVCIQSSSEEVLCRCFLYKRLLWSYKIPAVAIFGNAIFFGLIHLTNEGIDILSVINIIAVGVLFSFLVYYLDSPYAAFAAHTAWNFFQNIVLGLPNSGIVLPYSVFKLETATAQNSFAYNTAFGIEGTLLADIVIILACVLVYLYGEKHTDKPALFAKLEENSDLL